MQECLAYFRLALADPDSVPSWDEWWAANRELVENTFSLVDYVRLKHRGLVGARQILDKLDAIPSPGTSPSQSAG